MVEQQYYFEKEESGKLVQIDISKNHDKEKVYLNIHDGKNFTNVELSEEAMDGIYNTLAELLNY